ncbi:MAG: NYN domain-containing protein [Actinomycetota bacterium]|nr:NYN domain-containing protein [Actinomycetota bacterium]
MQIIDSALLQPAVEAGRRALGEMEENEVPAALRKVAASTGGRLPPPFVHRLLSAMEEDPWLRDKAADAWPDADPEDSQPSRAASALFVLRPPGWELRLGQISAGLQGRGLREEVGRLQERLAGAEGQVREAQRRLQSSREEAAEARSAAERKLEEARGQLRRARDEGLEEARRAQRRAADLEGERDRLRTSLGAELSRVVKLRDELLRARRSVQEVSEQAGAGPPAVVWASRDPLEMARLLDELAVAARPAPEVEAQEPMGPEAWRLPPGVRADSPLAVDWLVSRTSPFTLLVDGYNLAFVLAPVGSADRQSRLRVNRELARVRRHASSTIRVVVVYDSQQSGGVTDARGPGGVEVRFTEAGHPADDEVVELARSATGPVAVVSSDREVRERSAAAGALVLWSEALVGWVRRRG